MSLVEHLIKRYQLQNACRAILSVTHVIFGAKISYVLYSTIRFIIFVSDLYLFLSYWAIDNYYSTD
ncbi:hypothetical protein AsAng_0060060 [Aureispira anguillae]|uniref:Uncharacterized protein n=1 Tax=Aureispira anguillae TaxID=2864201 RepID=A0A916DWV3_9BACT|nr:hypothetical protein AsAng_0060060 [Aureispira anguillae]